MPDSRLELRGFRQRFFGCLSSRSDELFKVAEAVLCADGPVTSLPSLSLSAVFRRGNGGLYDALAAGIGGRWSRRSVWCPRQDSNLRRTV